MTGQQRYRWRVTLRRYPLFLQRNTSALKRQRHDNLQVERHTAGPDWESCLRPEDKSDCALGFRGSPGDCARDPSSPPASSLNCTTAKPSRFRSDDSKLFAGTQKICDAPKRVLIRCFSCCFTRLLLFGAFSRLGAVSQEAAVSESLSPSCFSRELQCHHH